MFKHKGASLQPVQVFIPIGDTPQHKSSLQTLEVFHCVTHTLTPWYLGYTCVFQKLLASLGIRL